MYVKEEEWEAVSRYAMMEKSAKPNRDPFEQISLEIEVCKMNGQSGFRLHQRMLCLRRFFFFFK